MKKVLPLVALALLLPVGGFAETGFGVAGFLQSPALIGQEADTSSVALDDFAFGVNARFKLSFLQIEGLALATVGSAAAIDAHLAGGLAVDLLLLRLSAGLGPSLHYSFDQDLWSSGLNLKANADLKLGRVSVGASYMVALDATGGISLRRGSGLLGFSLLLW